VADDVILETQDLTKDFSGFQAVRGVSLRVRRGSIHALIGPNGAGKTTVFNLLTRFLPTSTGTIRFEGRDITHERPAAVARRGLVRSFQISAVFPNLTVLENVRVALQRQLGTSFHFWRSARSLDALDEKARATLELVGLETHRHMLAGELPYGRKRALELATTLALDPRLLLLDEPTQGMGHEDVARVADLIRRAAADRTVLLVEHNLSVVADLSDTITVLQRGRVLAEGSYAEVSRDPAVLEAYIGTPDAESEPEGAA
jgi:branched-chain amino acid transport system ATP-binding protein